MRIQSLDSFRLIAAFMVVSLHVSWPMQSVGSVMTDVCRIAVPYFFMVSGFFYKREHTFEAIKKISKYLIVSMLVYLGVEIFLYRSLLFMGNEISKVYSYKFWVCNSVPFCPVAWYLLSYIYILLLTYILRKNYIYILGAFSFLFSLGTGVYSRIIGIDNIDSLLWNCSFLSTYCWFALGKLIKQYYNTSTKSGLNPFMTGSSRTAWGGYLILIVVGFACSILEHVVIKKITQMPVDGTVFIGTLPAITGTFCLLLNCRSWSMFRGGINLRQMSLFVFLSHVAIQYFFVSFLWPERFNLSYAPIINIPVDPIFFVNNIFIFAICCLLFLLFNTLRLKKYI